MTGVVTLNAWSAWAHTCVLGCCLLASPALPRAAALETEPTTAAAVSPEAARARLAALRAEIAHHDDLYFRQAKPEITDAAYDRLKRELRELEREFPPAAEAAPSLGDDRTGEFPVYRHREPMLSLDKAYTETELRVFRARITKQLGATEAVFVVEPKYDGLALSVTYEHGRLVRAVTRGNGVAGDDITVNARTLPSLPAQLRGVAPDGTPQPVPEFIELRGELFLPWAEFHRINREQEAEGLPVFAHPRNLAAGTAKSHDPAEFAARKLAVVFYGWGACEPAAARPASQREFLARVRSWGLPAPDEKLVRPCRSADEIWRAIGEFDRTRAKLSFPVDGAVVKLDAVAPRADLGATAHAPRWAIAYKFAPATAVTQLRAITVQVGRTGALTPVAELTPIEIAGSTITRTTLHNPDRIARLDLRIGDFVVVEKAGEVIPAITGVELARRLPDSAPYVFPTECPSCGSPVAREPGAATPFCRNHDCPAQLRRRLQHFASKNCLAIDGFGAATIDALVERGLVHTLADVYRLRRADLLALPRFGPASADALLASINRSRRAELRRVIQALALPGVGAAGAKKLAARFTDLAQLAGAARAELEALLGPAAGAECHAFIASPRGRALLRALHEIRSAAPPPPAAASANTASSAP